MPRPTKDQVLADLQGLSPEQQAQYMDELEKRFPVEAQAAAPATPPKPEGFAEGLRQGLFQLPSPTAEPRLTSESQMGVGNAPTSQLLEGFIKRPAQLLFDLSQLPNRYVAAPIEKAITGQQPRSVEVADAISGALDTSNPDRPYENAGGQVGEQLLLSTPAAKAAVGGVAGLAKNAMRGAGSRIYGLGLRAVDEASERLGVSRTSQAKKILGGQGRTPISSSAVTRESNKALVDAKEGIGKAVGSVEVGTNNPVEQKAAIAEAKEKLVGMGKRPTMARSDAEITAAKASLTEYDKQIAQAVLDEDQQLLNTLRSERKAVADSLRPTHIIEKEIRDFNTQRAKLVFAMKETAKNLNVDEKKREAFKKIVDQINALRPDEIQSKLPGLIDRTGAYNLPAETREKLAGLLASRSFGAAASGGTTSRLGVPGLGLLAGFINPSTIVPSAAYAVAANPTVQRAVGAGVYKAAPMVDPLTSLIARLTAAQRGHQ